MKKSLFFAVISTFLISDSFAGTARDFVCSNLDRKQIVDVWSVNERLSYLMLAQQDLDTPNVTDYRLIVYDYRQNEFLNVHLLDEAASGRQPPPNQQRRNQINGKELSTGLFIVILFPVFVAFFFPLFFS